LLLTFSHTESQVLGKPVEQWRMIRKSVQRFSEKVMCKQRAEARW